MKNQDLYWHFLPADKRLQYGDNRIVRVGRTLKVKCRPVLCHAGLHAYRRAIDALSYAPGPIICRVTLGGEIVHGDDKSAATERTVLWMADATDTLHRFACAVAQEALERAGVTDERCRNAIRVKLLWLEGAATDEELNAALDAAWDAARDAAWLAAWTSARDAARPGACLAARLAARAAALDAARDTSARDDQNRRLESMLNELAPPPAAKRRTANRP